MKPVTALYWDFQNVKIPDKKVQLLYQYLDQKFDLLISNAYAYWRREKELVEQTVFQVGIETITVPSREKNAVDNLIIKHCKKHINNDRRIRNVILITGDKDYLTLVEDLKKLGIKVILIYGSNISQGLKKAVNEVYQINQIVSINPNQEESKKLEHPALVTYEEAKKYLIELIKTVQAKGKKATLALMGNLIKDHPRISGCKKVSYCRPDGKIVSKFSKFVEAVIQEGIIQKNRNGELILVTI